MILPAVLLTVLFFYLPMSGLILAFKDYRYDLGIFGSEWTGLNNFRFFFISGTGLKVTINTLVYSIVNLVTSQGLAILIAVIITELGGKLFKKITQSVIFLPYFISWITVGVFVLNIFNPEYGVLNSFRELIGLAPIDLYRMPKAWFPIIVIFNSWKWAGFNSIIFISAITAIDAECYEAAEIDGANIWQRIWRVTLPSIIPTIMIVLLLNVGRVLRGDFQMFYQIIGNNGQLFNTTDIIDTFVFRSLINGGDIGMTTAATLYQSILCFIFIIVTNKIVKIYEPDYALF